MTASPRITRARALAGALADLPGVTIDLSTVQTNIVCFEVGDAAGWVSRLAAAGVLSNAMGPRTVRLVTHKDIDDAALERAVDALRTVSKAAAATTANAPAGAPER